jgi:plasmid maintenance system antidote protein VapI
MDIDQNTVDDEGTGQDEAREMLRAFCDNGFDGDEEKAALALGRPSSEIREMLGSESQIDDDLAMKIRSIANERSIEID